MSYATPEFSPPLVLLREEAKKAGVELNLQLLDPSTWGTQIGEKKHEMTLLTFSTGLTPSFWQRYHSENAHKPQTNNITNLDDKALDKLIDEYENASRARQPARALARDPADHQRGGRLHSVVQNPVRPRGVLALDQASRAYGTPDLRPRSSIRSVRGSCGSTRT